MNRAVIAGDIIAFTSLSLKSKQLLEDIVKAEFSILNNNYQTYGRLIKGDTIECYVPNKVHSLRVALIFKSKIKSVTPLINDNLTSRVKAFKSFGIRLAIGIGEITRFDPIAGIIDGEAIYLAGRTLNELGSTSDKARIVIKNTLCIKSFDKHINKEFQPVISLLDVILNNATAKQSEVIYNKLLGFNDEKIASLLGVKQATINEHSTKAGWNAIEKSICRFEEALNRKQ